MPGKSLCLAVHWWISRSWSFEIQVCYRQEIWAFSKPHFGKKTYNDFYTMTYVSYEYTVMPPELSKNTHMYYKV